MADAMRNEVAIKIGEKDLTMRATVDALKGIESDLRKGIYRLYRDIAGGDYGLGEIITILFHGLKAAENDTKFTTEQVAQEVVSMGLDNASASALEFLTKSMVGQSMGKSNPGTN